MVQCVILCCRNVHNSIFIFDQPCINYKCIRSVKFAAARPFFLWLVPRWRAYLAIPFADWLPDGLAGHLAWLLRAGWLTGLAGRPGWLAGLPSVLRPARLLLKYRIFLITICSKSSKLPKS